MTESAVRTKKRYRLRHDNGSYYKGMSGVGPSFTKNSKEAKTFSSRYNAGIEMLGHWAMGDCRVEVVHV